MGVGRFLSSIFRQFLVGQLVENEGRRAIASLPYSDHARIVSLQNLRFEPLSLHRPGFQHIAQMRGVPFRNVAMPTPVTRDESLTEELELRPLAPLATPQPGVKRNM
jgi:hypothetical protein